MKLKNYFTLIRPNWALKTHLSASYLLLRVLHPSHSHLPPAGHPHRVSVGGRGAVGLSRVRRPLLLGVRVVAHPVKLRTLHRHRVHGRHLRRRTRWIISDAMNLTPCLKTQHVTLIHQCDKTSDDYRAMTSSTFILVRPEEELHLSVCFHYEKSKLSIHQFSSTISSLFYIHQHQVWLSTLTLMDGWKVKYLYV